MSFRGIMEAQKKWSLILSEIESSVSNTETLEDCSLLLNKFESIEEDYRDQHAEKMYMFMWKIALRLGKLNLANSYANKFLEYLIELKRIPQIKKFILELKVAGLFKNKKTDHLVLEEILLGKKEKITHNDFNRFDCFHQHPEHWKYSVYFLEQYLLLDENWKQEQWTLCYEYILMNHFNKDIFKVLFFKIEERNNSKIEKKMIDLFKTKNIKIQTSKDQKKQVSPELNKKLNIDYDQLAMELLSGQKNPNQEEQVRVINSLKFILDSELLVKGQDMIVAFELLGMEQVVLILCERLIKIQEDIKSRASTYYVWAQSLYNTENYFGAVELIAEVLEKEPLLKEEQMAFLYLKAESFYKLKNIKMAKKIYLEIKKGNPHYRLVGERLKTIEAS